MPLDFTVSTRGADLRFLALHSGSASKDIYTRPYTWYGSCIVSSF